MIDEKGNLIKINKEIRKSPDLSKLKRVKIDDNTIVYVTPEKLEKFGEQHFIDLIKDRKINNKKSKPVELDLEDELNDKVV